MFYRLDTGERLLTEREAREAADSRSPSERAGSPNPADRLLPHERPKADQKDMRVLTPTEIEVLLGHASSDRWKALFALLAFTGLRVSEALALTWDDITPTTVTVRASKTDAGVREVMLITRVHMMLTKLRLAQPAGTRLVFATSTGTPVARRSALVALRAAEKSRGLPDYTLHQLRHTFASMLIAQGESVALVADQMGHVNPAITLSTYAKLFDAQKNVEAVRGSAAGSGGRSGVNGVTAPYARFYPVPPDVEARIDALDKSQHPERLEAEIATIMEDFIRTVALIEEAMCGQAS